MNACTRFSYSYPLLVAAAIMGKSDKGEGPMSLPASCTIHVPLAYPPKLAHVYTHMHVGHEHWHNVWENT